MTSDSTPVEQMCAHVVGGTPGDSGGTLSFCGLPIAEYEDDGRRGWVHVGPQSFAANGDHQVVLAPTAVPAALAESSASTTPKGDE